MSARRSVAPLLVAALLAARAGAQDVPPAAGADPAPAVTPPKAWLVLEGPDLRVRRPIGASAVVARYLLDRDAAAPRAGEEVVGERGVAVKWTAAETKDGKLDPGAAAWAFATVESDADRVVLAKVAGAATVWVNGEPFVGDVYGYGFDGVPVALRKGANHVYLSGLRGEVSVALSPAGAGVALVPWDTTAAHRHAVGAPVGVVAVNPTREPVVVTALMGWGPAWEERRRVRLLPLGVAKIPFVEVAPPSPPSPPEGAPPEERAKYPPAAYGASIRVEGPIPVGVSLSVPLEERGAAAPRRLTHVSDIDGSVQEYAVVEPAPSLVAVPTRIVLSLHGAGVDCMSQARSYSRRPGVWVICPTNRRPYGFDWQDWGRLDAYETLADFGARIGQDVSRVFVTGHSMGGHGTWHLAANDPDRFAAIAPSAGWASFDTYAGGPRPASPLSPLWRGADRGSDTLDLATNLAALPTFVLHGTKDDNVPLAQAELMLTTLRDAGGAPAWHFQEGAGHWWDGDAAPGADCVDWPAIFELFEKTDPAAPAPETLDWTTVDPSIDARHHWIGATLPQQYGTPLRIRATWDAKTATATLTTENALRIEVAPPGAPESWTAVIDGKSFHGGSHRAWFERFSDGWNAVPNLPDERKKPSRSGPLKHAFARRFALVVPTKGTEAETRETTARVRFDAEQWWYRANGFADVVFDTDVLADPARFEGRNLILYGNADTNAAWRRVLGAAPPVDVRRGEVRVGTHAFASDSAAFFFVRPRADDAFGLAAALGDTGPRGCRVAMAHALFISGAGYPDYVAWDARVFTEGDGGVLAAGWFDAEWKLDGKGHVAPAAAPGGK